MWSGCFTRHCLPFPATDNNVNLSHDRVSEPPSPPHEEKVPQTNELPLPVDTTPPQVNSSTKKTQAVPEDDGFPRYGARGFVLNRNWVFRAPHCDISSLDSGAGTTCHSGQTSFLEQPCNIQLSVSLCKRPFYVCVKRDHPSV